MARKILLADDSVTAQNMGRRILGDAGYDVITVNNGSAALKKIAEFKPDVVILDVYMPGYGGLEVCQRIKESRETASIPVLITVGKMEPFKAEEANKVKADAHMVKPFETNELLAAIARLEDKIVPAPEAAKTRSGRLTAEKKASSSKVRSPEVDVEDATVVSTTDTPKKSSKSKSSVERDSGSHDTEFRDTGFRNFKRADTKHSATVENSSGENQEFSGQKSFEVSPSDEFLAAAFPPVAAEPVVESTPSPLANETSEAVAFSRENDDLAATFASSDAQHDESNEKSVFESNRTYRENEVVAALASLVPMASDDDKLSEVSEQPAVQSPVMKITGPRWVAESIPLSQDEAATMLASEMEKAYAASAAAEGDRNRIAEAAALGSEPLNLSRTAEATSEEAATAMSAAPESQAEVHAELVTAAVESVSEASEVVSAIGMPADISNTDAPAAASEKHEDAFAAAASAGAGADVRSEIGHETRTVSAGQSTDETSDEDLNAQRMSSAWANWKQIRESIVGQNLIPSITTPAPMVEANRQAESASFELPGFKEIRREARSAAELDEQGASVPSATASKDQASEISSIVDTMLAELKPKLMEEIARKMGKDSKKD
ncbi:MAG: response regulator [Acidobacteriota bacterium]|nr:response regulator [Acidobacteriota bacterium]